MQLRPYQIDIKKKLSDAFKQHRKVCLQLPTGGGKTVTLVDIARDISNAGRRVFILVHRKELIDQTANKLRKFGIEMFSVIQSDYVYRHFAPIQIASVQTLVKRLENGIIPPDFIITDECFPAGTLIDGKPIEFYKVGDSIHAYDEKTKSIKQSKVIRTFKNPVPDQMIELLINGSELICTKNHPILTTRGWKKAQDITLYDRIGVENVSNMHRMRISNSKSKQTSERCTKEARTNLLFNSMRTGIFSKTVFGNNVSDKSEIRFRKNEIKKSYEEIRNQRESFSNTKSNWSQTKNSRGEWKTFINTTSDISQRTEMGDRTCGKDRIFRQRGFRIPQPLQNRYCQSYYQNRDRSRRIFSLPFNKTRAGSEKRNIPNFIRVDNIKILKQTDTREFRRVCPDNFVYNLEVERYHTYIANGIIVHNCHHATANTYRKIYENYPDARHMGVSATPIRTDGEGFKDIFETMVCGPTVNELIEQGYLVKPKIFANPLPFDLKKVKVTAGDYNEKALVEAFENSYTYGNLVDSWRSKADGKKTIVFAITIEHSKHIVETYKNTGVIAEHLDGGTPKQEREAILRRFREGKTTVVSNVGIISEGFDVPDCECIQLVRPTKSLALYLQMVGRGLRPADGKDHAVILDHSNSVFMHGFPEQDRIWTLKGVTRKFPNRQMMVRDLKTGDEYEPRDLPSHVTEIELIEIEMDAIRQAEMDELIAQAQKRGFKIGFAWHKFLEKYQIPTKYEIQRFQKIAGYKSGWVRFKLEEFNLV